MARKSYPRACALFRRCSNGEGKGVMRQAHDAVVKAIETVLKQGTRTPDLDGVASTTTKDEALAARVV